MVSRSAVSAPKQSKGSAARARFVGVTWRAAHSSILRQRSASPIGREREGARAGSGRDPERLPANDTSIQKVNKLSASGLCLHPQLRRIPESLAHPPPPTTTAQSSPSASTSRSHR